MGSRKQHTAERIREEKKDRFFAKLNNCPTSPRKMRLIADLIRGKRVEEASALLQFNKKESSIRMEKLLRSAISNYEQKSGDSWENAGLVVKEVYVDSARMLKRIQPAPQGRAHRIRKRSNHVTLVLESTNQEEQE